MPHLFKLWLVCLVHYARMAVFRSSPSNLPYDPRTIAVSLAAYLIVGVILLSPQRSLWSIIAQVMVEVGILATISVLVLNLKQKTERLPQTLSALIGVNLIISLVMIPVFHFLPAPMDGEAVHPFAQQVTIVLLVWNLAALSLIFKRAFEIQTALAGFIAFNYFLLYEFILISLFP